MCHTGINTMEIKQRKTISIDELIALDEERKLETKSDEKTKQAPSGAGSIQERTPNDKYYLPVLNINHLPEWQSKPLSERKHFTDEVAMKTCLGNCCGVAGLKGACCHLDPYDLEHILGPVDEKWINDTVKWFRKKGLNFSRQDIVIDYEEGKIIGENLFKESNNNNIFQERTAYPFLRFQVVGPRYACKFMNPLTYKCQIYEVRPGMCRDYLCQYISTNFLVKTKNKPNTWQKTR